jgi:hypothetical protein
MPARKPRREKRVFFGIFLESGSFLELTKHLPSEELKTSLSDDGEAQQDGQEALGARRRLPAGQGHGPQMKADEHG